MKYKTDKKVGFIGGGQMGEAIFSGLLAAGTVHPENMYVSARTQEKAEALAEKYPGIFTLVSADEAGIEALVKSSEIVVIATLPQQASFILPAVQKALDPAVHTVVSIMGGPTLAQIEASIPEAAVVRVMPNTPMSVREGACGVCGGKNASPVQVKEIIDLFGTIGLAIEIAEDQMDALTGISGCGPAFCAQFICGLADAGVAAGLPRDKAIQLAAQTLVGTGRMVLESGQHPEILKDNVCSPGGSTIAGCVYLEKNAFRGIASGAVESAIRRMRGVAEEA